MHIISMHSDWPRRIISTNTPQDTKMLPHHGHPPSRLGKSSCSIISCRRVLLGSALFLFSFCFYINYKFFSFTQIPHTPQPTTKAEIVSDSKQHSISYIVFTSGCTDRDLVRAEILAATARQYSYENEIYHLLYSCSAEAYQSIVSRKNPQHRVRHFLYEATVDSQVFLFGEPFVETSIHPIVIQKWLELDEQFKDAQKIPEKFMMLVDNDAIFTKRLDMSQLMKEVEAASAKWYSQDAEWYIPGKSPLMDEEKATLLAKSFPINLDAVSDVKKWRGYGGRAPYISEVGVFLAKIAPTAAQIWPNLALHKRHLAYPLAGVHHQLEMGISGVLSVHHYSSRYENWDFADDVQSNPCLEITEKDQSLSSFPITIRAINFTLPEWIDGREWSIVNDQIPSDILHCDAYLLREPTADFWVLASTTKGFERISSILRRRHAVVTCMAIRAYNQVVRAYKQHLCTSGYNQNKRIQMNLDAKLWRSALPFGPNASMDTKRNVYFGDLMTKEIAEKVESARPGQEGNDDVHFVYVSQCTTNDNLQSEILASSFANVGQSGWLTRIITGCDAKGIRQILSQTSANTRLRLYFTRDFSSDPSFEKSVTPSAKRYALYNKPFGVRDWILHANPPIQESIIVMLELDFIFLQPLCWNSNMRIASSENVDSKVPEQFEIIRGLKQYKRYLVHSTPHVFDASDHVMNGKAIAQRALSQNSVRLSSKWDEYHTICSECGYLAKEDVTKYDEIGNLRIITLSDLEKIVDDYCLMSVQIHEQNLALQDAETIGYTLSAIKHRIQHTIFDNYVLTEGKHAYSKFVARIPDYENPCSESGAPFLLHEISPILSTANTYKYTDSDGLEWKYHSQLVPDNLFACDTWLLAQPPSAIWQDLSAKPEMYGLCTAIKAVNQVLISYKSRFCTNDYNTNKQLRLVEPRKSNELHIGDNQASWQKGPV